MNACSQNSIKNWEDINVFMESVDTTTAYDFFVKNLGKPFEEYPTPSLLEEYVLYYKVPEDTSSHFWIMLDTDTKKFIYWSKEKF